MNDIFLKNNNLDVTHASVRPEVHLEHLKFGYHWPVPGEGGNSVCLPSAQLGNPTAGRPADELTLPLDCGSVSPTAVYTAQAIWPASLYGRATSLLKVRCAN